MAKEYDVFISYRHEDNEHVETLVRALQKRALSVWYDREVLAPGAPWQEAIEGALQSSRSVLIFIGPGGIGPWAQAEISYGIREQMKDPGFRVIPVLGPGATPEQIPPLLRNLSSIDLRHLDREAFDQLSSALRSRPSLADSRRGVGGVPKVFLCHAKEDAARIERLYFALQDEGLDPWYDKKKLVVGVRWEDEIIRAIEQTDFFAFFLSSRSVKKTGFIQKEIRTAVREYQRRPQDIAYLLPVRLEDCDVPRIQLDANTVLPDLQWIDVFEERTEAVSDLAAGIWEQWNRMRQEA